jgi:NAD(P)H dehydrogenase (quinone)
MLVITGANGRLGRLIVGELAKAGHSSNVRLATRDPEKVRDLTKLGFEAVAADFNDSNSLDAAFKQASTILLISATGATETRLPLHKNAIDAAIRAKPQRIVYTSRVNPTEQSIYAYAPIHAFSEARLLHSGIPYTIARNNEYSENLSFSIKEALENGKIMLPGSTGKVPYISVADIARVMAKLLINEKHLADEKHLANEEHLANEKHRNKIYEINGPEALDPAAISQLLEAASKRPIKHLKSNADEYAARVESRGRPPFMVAMIKTLHQAIDAGEFATVYNDAQTILGEPPESLSHYIQRVYGSSQNP